VYSLLNLLSSTIILCVLCLFSRSWPVTLRALVKIRWMSSVCLSTTLTKTGQDVWSPKNSKLASSLLDTTLERTDRWVVVVLMCG